MTGQLLRQFGCGLRRFGGQNTGQHFFLDEFVRRHGDHARRHFREGAGEDQRDAGTSL
jgi:hypothetical protein